MSKNLVPPTGEYIKTLADKQGLVYTIGNKGNERFYADDKKHSPIYPPNDGVVGDIKVITLRKGTIIDRYGSDKGRFVSPKGEPKEKRSLPRTKRFEDSRKRVYKVVKDIELVEKGITAAWFGKPGGAVQYKLPNKVRELLGTYLEEGEMNDF